MKKIIKLTESDLTRIVKRVIKEEDDMESMGISITVKDIFEQVKDALNDIDGYDEPMKERAMDLAKEIMGDLRDDLSTVLVNYITENYENHLYAILGDEDYDDEDEDF